MAAAASRPTTKAALPAGLMRAAVYDTKSPEGIKVVSSRQAPRPTSNALLVRVEACGINPVDAKFVVADKLPERFRWLARRAVNGNVAGFDLSGVVEHAPPGCGFKPGDEVFGAVPPFRGSFAELVSVPLDQVALKPPCLSHAQAAALVLPGITVVQALSQHGFRAGQSVLVVGGSGGVGHLAIQIAKARGAGRVAAVCSGKNVEFVKSLGADDVVDYTRKPTTTTTTTTDDATTTTATPPPTTTTDEDTVVRDLQDIVEARGGAPFDLVIDTVSSHDGRDSSWEYERRIRTASDPPLVATRATGGPDVDPHNYVTIGSHTRGWVLAGIKRLLGVNLFGRGRELFWITFPGCRPDLDTLRGLAEGGGADGGGEDRDRDRGGDDSTSVRGKGGEGEGGRGGGGGGGGMKRGVRPEIDGVVQLTDEGVREGFRRLNGRRVRGKIVLQVS